jgi:hypothetical protein
MDRLPIDALTADPRNPRRISDRARAGLSVSLETFGPLDLVFNEETKQIVSGHQRIAALKAAGAIEMIHDGEWCYIEHPITHERFPVRMVRWSEERQRMANLVANNAHLGGEFTEDAIAQLRELENEPEFGLLALDDLERELERQLDSDKSPNKGAEAKDQSTELRESFQIVVTCVDERHQATLLDRFIEEGLKCRALI